MDPEQTTVPLIARQSFLKSDFDQLYVHGWHHGQKGGLRLPKDLMVADRQGHGRVN